MLSALEGSSRSRKKVRSGAKWSDHGRLGRKFRSIPRPDRSVGDTIGRCQRRRRGRTGAPPRRHRPRRRIRNAPSPPRPGESTRTLPVCHVEGSQLATKREEAIQRIIPRLFVFPFFRVGWGRRVDRSDDGFALGVGTGSVSARRINNRSLKDPILIATRMWSNKAPSAATLIFSSCTGRSLQAGRRTHSGVRVRPFGDRSGARPRRHVGSSGRRVWSERSIDRMNRSILARTPPHRISPVSHT